MGVGIGFPPPGMWPPERDARERGKVPLFTCSVLMSTYKIESMRAPR
jgi:hypothetical protein